MEAGTSVTIRLGPNDLAGEHALALTQSQINKMINAYHNKIGVAIKMSKTQLDYNENRVDGGFIAALALATGGKVVLSSVLSLGQSALAALRSAAATNIVDKISGKGVLYATKNGMGCSITSTGNELYLSP